MLASISRKLTQFRGIGAPRWQQRLALVNEWLAPQHRPEISYDGNGRVLVRTRIGGHDIAYYVESDDRVLSPWFIATGHYEADVTGYFLRHLRADSHCLDIGANFGFFACLMAKQCPRGRVLGIEPDRRIADLARDNLFANGLGGRADIICAAASHNGQGLTLYRRASRSASTSIVKPRRADAPYGEEPVAEAFKARSVRIDDLAEGLEGRVDFVKIDVEGAEPLVLAGARETIRRNRDITIVMEWSPAQIAAAGFDVEAFAEDTTALGLQAFSLERHGEEAIEPGKLAKLPYQTGIVLRRM